jgi:hypothetical protein
MKIFSSEIINSQYESACQQTVKDSKVNEE